MSGQSQPQSVKPAIVVTGASSGIGREIARAAAGDGQPVVLVARSKAALDGFRGRASNAAGRGGDRAAVGPRRSECRDRDRKRASAARVGSACDVLVNSAGFGLAGRAAELPRTEQMRLVDLNIRALTELSLRFLPGMVARGRGGILNVGSLAGYTPGPNMATYHASKAFVRSFSAALASEVAGHGVTVTCLSPGFVRTAFLDQLPIKKSRIFKAMPRADAAFTAQAGWRGFRAGRRLVIPRLVDRIAAGLLMVLPSRLVPAIKADLPDRGTNS